MKNLQKYPKYQDYVIKDGKLVGEFEDMYQDYCDPWEQSKEIESLDKALGLLLLKKYKHKRALEYGCGLGNYVEQLKMSLGFAAGVDISQTAVKKARVLYPGNDFYVGDINNQNILSSTKPDVLVFAEISWYVLNKLDDFKELINSQCSGLGFLHLLTVYSEGKQKYGCEYFTNLEEICNYWSDAIEINEVASIQGSTGEAIRTIFYGKIR